MAQLRGAQPLAVGWRRPLLRVVGPVSRPVAVGLVLALDKEGLELAVSPFGPFQLGGRFAPTGDEDAVLLVKGKDPALAGAEGARELAGEGSTYLYLVTEPRLYPPETRPRASRWPRDRLVAQSRDVQGDGEKV